MSTWDGVPLNPYDPTSQDYTPETVPHDEVIRTAIEAAFLRKKFWLPGKVTKVLGNQKVNVQIEIQGRYIDGTPYTLPEVQNCTVQMPKGNGYSIKLPVAVGDEGGCLFSDRSLDAWLVSGGMVDPTDARNHDLQDLIFVPGGAVPTSQQTQDSTTDLVITNGQSVLRVQKAGTFVLTNGTNELLNLLDLITGQVKSLSQTLSTDTVNTIFGPQKLNAFLTYEEIYLQLQSLQEKLETLKGS